MNRPTVCAVSSLPSDERASFPADLLTATACAVFVLAFYVVLYPLHGYRVPIGSDTPVYVWWSRLSGAIGIGGLGTRSRALVAGLMATLARVTGASDAAVAESLGPALGASLALGAGALVHAALGRDRPRFVLAAVLTGSFLSLMVAGYLSTVAFGSMFLAVLTVLATATRVGRWSAVVAGAGLLAAAGLSHLLFLALAAAVLAGAIVALVPLSIQRVRSGSSPARTPAAQVAWAAAGGGALAMLGYAAIGGGLPPPDTSRDSILRRAGLGDLLRTSYRRKLRHDFPWYRLLVVTAAALCPLALRPTVDRERTVERGSRHRLFTARLAQADPGRLVLWGSLASWLLVTVGGVAALVAGLAASPGQRLAAFCLPLPILGAIGLAMPRSTRGRALSAAAAVVFVVVGWLAWGRQTPLVSPDTVVQARTAAAALARQPIATPLIVVADDRTDKPGLFVTRWANYVREQVPPARIPDVRVFVGTPDDLKAGRPGLTGQVEHDRMSLRLWQDVRPALSRRPLAVVIDAFGHGLYRDAAGMPGARVLGPGVVALPGFEGAGATRYCEMPCGPPGDDASVAEPGPGPLSPWTAVWLAPILLALAGVFGVSWSTLALGHADHLLRLALAPAFGTAALGLAAVGVDALGLRLAGAGGWVAAAAAAAGWVALAPTLVRARRASA